MDEDNEEAGGKTLTNIGKMSGEVSQTIKENRRNSLIGWRRRAFAALTSQASLR